MKDLLSDLTPMQRRAVTTVEGPLLILAGPGSGKTRVITRRIGYLLQQGIPPRQILAITFTNKAAGEMRRRVEELAPASGVWISTFHRLGVRLLREFADVLELDRNFTIFDMKDRSQLLKQAVEDANYDPHRYSPDRVGAVISRAKNQLLGPAEFAQQAGDFFEQVVAKVYPAYQQRLRRCQALDFDDLLYWVAVLLRRFPEIRAELDARFRYVMIDEYQDTNKAQYEIARHLCLDYPHLCVVGDPDQSIYRFRGSDLRNILDFERDFPQAVVIPLGQNFRSTQAILRAADHLIQHNTRRKPRPLTTANPPGQPVTVLEFASGSDEAEAIAARIRAAVETGSYRYRDFAIFLRINALSRVLERAMIHQRVPYQIVRGLSFFERKENKDILAYLRLIANPADDLSFERIINEPPRGIGPVTLERLRLYAQARELSLLAAAREARRVPGVKPKVAAELEKFAGLIEDLARMQEAPASELIEAVLSRSGYRDMLSASPELEDQERLANIEELVSAAHEFERQSPDGPLRAFLEHITLISDIDDWDESQDRVSIMTLHAAKGLEFPVVFLPALEQGILPHERSLSDPEELEEERRLAFVGMTRAQRELYLSHAQMRDFRGRLAYAVASLFLSELPKDVVVERHPSLGSCLLDDEAELPAGPEPEAVAGAEPRAAVRSGAAAPPAAPVLEGLSPGVLVRHRTYGLGRVTRVSGLGKTQRVTVAFAHEGERTFIVGLAPLEVVRQA
jgi:DNA helicase-2/ATP-dependent DNA helicase PcrA